MTCQISLGPDNDLELITPAGRRLYVPIGPHSTKWLFDILWNALRKVEAPGYVNSYPTQAVLKAWEAEVKAKFNTEQAELRAEKAAARRAEIEAKFGFSLDDLEI
jgi:hypothetical protein